MSNSEHHPDNRSSDPQVHPVKQDESLSVAGVLLAVAGVGAPMLGNQFTLLSPLSFIAGLVCGVLAWRTGFGKFAVVCNLFGLVASVLLITVLMKVLSFGMR